MDMYLLKFSGCLFLFYLVYALFLEKQNNHHFKRFYLIGGVLSSIMIPLITIKTYVVSSTESNNNFEQVVANNNLTANLSEINTPLIELSDILWTVYIIGATVFLVRFVINLNKLYKDISSNESIRIAPLTYILLDKNIIPHSFFKYIFLYKRTFKDGSIPEEVLLHEETHAQQLHSLDIILLELVQIVFWFHPLIYIIKQRIKLNHEFLADNAVLNQGISTKNYQHILLQYSSYSNHHQLASAINYSSIKKRFTVMKTQTSKTRIWLSTLLLIPLFSLLLVGFTTKKEITIDSTELSSSQQYNSNPSFLEFIVDMENQGASFYLDDEKITAEAAKTIAKNNRGKRTEMLTQKDSNDKYVVKLYSTSDKHYARSIEVEVLNDNAYLIDGKRATKKTFRNVFNQLHQDISKEIRDKIINIHVTASKTLSNEEVWFIYNALEGYGYHRIVTSNQEIIRSKGNTPFAIEGKNVEQQKSPSKKEIADYKAWIKQLDGKAITFSKAATQYPILDEKELIKYQNIYKRMTTQQKNAVKEFPFPGLEFNKNNEDLRSQSLPTQQEATKEQMDEYNRLAKSYNSQPEGRRIIKMKDYKRMKYIYDLMSPKQRKNAHPLPKLPPPPPRAMHKGEVNDGIFNKYNKWIKGLKNPDGTYKIISSGEQRYYQSIYDNMTADQKKRSAGIPPPPPPPKPKVIEVKDVPAPPPSPKNIEVKELPPPPPPQKPADYIKDMAKTNAKFYYEGKQITSKEALIIVNKNQSLIVKTKKSDTRTPEVYLTDAPVIKEIKRN